MAKIIVLVTKGKLDKVDSVRVSLFDSVQGANDFITGFNSVTTKYWQSAEIVDADATVELVSAFGN